MANHTDIELEYAGAKVADQGGGHWSKCMDIRSRFEAGGVSAASQTDMDDALWAASVALVKAHTQH